ncbi:hypothetical protein HDU85_001691 [Gaertneriomyces sp. JEL0708]|nr:hypothetical protein HDU85_001691 [Gaertneriomyces sp. JEL0708]
MSPSNNQGGRHHLPHLSPRMVSKLHKIKNQTNYYSQAKLFFRFTGSVIPTITLPVILITLWSALWTPFYMVDSVNFLKEWNILPKSTLLITVVSVVMSLLLVFRNNTAYDRYWEGRRIWSNLETQIRNMARFIWIGVVPKSPQDVASKRGAMNLLVAYAHSIKHYLRNELGVDYPDLRPFINHLPEFAPDNNEPPEIKNVPLEITYQLSAFVDNCRDTGQIDISQFGLMNNALNAAMDCFSGAERVRGTPLPLAYSIHLKQTLIVYLLGLPFQLVIENKWGAIPITFLASFTLLGLEAIGGEIENPFGLDTNDIPLDEICDTLYQEILSIMERPEDLDPGLWSVPYEDLSSTHAKLNQEDVTTALSGTVL